MRPTRASSFGEAVIIGTEVYNTLNAHVAHECARNQRNTLMFLLVTDCALFLVSVLCLFQFSGAFVNVWKLFCARRLDSLDSLHPSGPERPMRQVTSR